MNRQLLTLTLAALFGALVLNANTASACCHKNKAGCAPAACAPAPAPAPEPAPAPAECPPPKKCCGLFGGGHKFKLFGHCKKRAACAPVVCATPYYAPAPAWVAPSPQASPQASGQG